MDKSTTTKNTSGYGLKCSYYTKTFPTLDELIEDIVISGMDPNYKITVDGKVTNEKAWDHIVE
jgi:hypothetical protein